MIFSLGYSNIFFFLEKGLLTRREESAVTAIHGFLSFHCIRVLGTLLNQKQLFRRICSSFGCMGKASIWRYWHAFPMLIASIATVHRGSSVLPNCLWQNPSSSILYAWRFRRFDLLTFYAALYPPLCLVALTLLFPCNFVKESFHGAEYIVKICLRRSMCRRSKE